MLTLPIHDFSIRLRREIGEGRSRPPEIDARAQGRTAALNRLRRLTQAARA
jgi:hypothetical protein